MVAAAQKALSEGFHQYTRTAGHPRLVQLLSKRYSKHFGREVDAFSQVNETEKKKGFSRQSSCGRTMLRGEEEGEEEGMGRRGWRRRTGTKTKKICEEN